MVRWRNSIIAAVADIPEAGPRQTMIALALIVSGIILGVLCFRHDFSTPLTHDASNLARIAMLQETLNMILSHPWLGWGYGSFEYNFQHFRLAQETQRLVWE